MEYIDPFRDRIWEEQLKSRHILSTSDFANLEAPPSGHLMELLYLNADRIPEGLYLNWLIREHGFVRIPPVLVPTELVERWTQSQAQRNYLLENFLYPMAEEKYTITIAMGHPVDERQSDYMDKIFGNYLYRQYTAVTPAEANRMHKQYTEAGQ